MLTNTIKAVGSKYASGFLTKTNTVVATGTAFTKTTVEQVPIRLLPVTKTLGRNFAEGVVINLVTLELIDFVGHWYSEHKRRKDLKQVTTEVSELGLNDERKAKLEMLNRMPQRRTFGQFIRDLPPRTMRRFWRAVLFEAGWWTTLFTAPVWIATTVLYTVWSWVFVLPIAAWREMHGKHGKESEEFLDKWMGRPGGWNKKVLKWTLWLGFGGMSRAVNLKIYSRAEVYCNEEGERVLTLLEPEAYKTVHKIQDEHTAEVWGAALADLVRQEDDFHRRWIAYAQSNGWIEEHIVEQYKESVRTGFRSKTPFLFRDLLTAR